MSKVDLRELKSRLEQSERKRIQLHKKLVSKSLDEEIPLWSMVDLMTLLLVFFLLLYSLTIKKIPSTFLNLNNERPVAEAEPPASLQAQYEKLLEGDDALDAIIEQPGKEVVSSVSQGAEYMPSTSLDTKRDESVEPIELTASFRVQDKTFSQESDSDQNSNAPVYREDDNLDVSIEKLRKEVLSVVNEDDKSVFSVRREQNRIVIVLGERISFRVGEAKLLDVYRPIFKQIANLISSKPEYQVVVSGHTDDKPIYTERFPSNWELSAARAINVAKSLIDNNVSPKRVSIQGFSQYRPLSENSNWENRQANRRVEIALIKEQDGQSTSVL